MSIKARLEKAELAINPPIQVIVYRREGEDDAQALQRTYPVGGLPSTAIFLDEMDKRL